MTRQRGMAQLYVLGAVGLLAVNSFALAMYYRGEATAAKGRADVLEQQQQILQDGLDQQRNTLATLERLAEAGEETRRELRTELRQIEQQHQGAQREINRLRLTAEQDARERPAAVGAAARRRLNDWLCAYADRDPGCHRADSASTDPGRAGAPAVVGDAAGDRGDGR